MHERIAGPSAASPPALPDPLAPCAPGSTGCSTGRGRDGEEWDLVAAVRALKLPGGAPYRGPIDAALLAQALDGLGFDAAGLAWLAAFQPRAWSPSHFDQSGRPQGVRSFK